MPFAPIDSMIVAHRGLRGDLLSIAAAALRAARDDNEFAAVFDQLEFSTAVPAGTPEKPNLAIRDTFA